MSARRWWLLSSGITGELSETYHYVLVNETACGIKLPPVYGRFRRCADSPADIRKKRCLKCVRELVESLPLVSPARQAAASKARS
jgi:hypothetical protein